ncbi:hypothetical protein ABT279_41395 [Amycolatopsis sp. NPDC000673]
MIRLACSGGQDRARSVPTVLTSPYGHDSFLIETEQISALVKTLLG